MMGINREVQGIIARGGKPDIAQIARQTDEEEPLFAWEASDYAAFAIKYCGGK